MALWLVALGIAGATIWLVWIYNRLVGLRKRVDGAWSDIDVQLRRRHDLVPALVAAVRGYADHERALLETVTTLRSEGIATESPARLARVESSLEKALGRLFMLREAYPELQASESFLRLQRELVEVENHLQYARRFYNGAVRDLNTRIGQFPDLLVARPLGFREAEFYAAEPEHRAVPATETGG
jgi:LemA protein